MASRGLSKEDTNTEHPLQAIVLADAWGEEARWTPLVRRKRTDDEEYDDAPVGGEQRPWCLLPLLDSPLLSWTLECLAATGVEQAFVFVRDGVDQVRAWLSTSSFSSPTSPLKIVLRPTRAATPGDVLREVDSLQILAPADYLVVQAGYVGNIDLQQKVNEFTERRKADPTMTMSCVVAPIATRTTSTYAVHTMSADAQLFHYEQTSLFPKLKRARLPREALEGGKTVRVRSDLESIGVAICSVEVAPLFTENFDYQFFYPDFVNGILTSDLLGKTICCTVIGEASCTISSTSLIGSDVKIGHNSNIQRSTLGSGVSVGSSTQVAGSYIFSGTRIGDDCRIRDSLIGERVVIGTRCTIEAGCIIAPDTVIGDGSRLSGVRISTEEPQSEDTIDSSKAQLATGSKGFILPLDEAADEEVDSDEEELDSRNFDVTRLGKSSSTTSLSTAASMSHSAFGASGDGDEPVIQGLEALMPSATTSQSDFVFECTQSLDRSFVEGHTVDNAAIELKTLRMASNVALDQVRQVVVPYILARCGPSGVDVDKVIKRWGGLISNVTGEQEEAMKHCVIVAQTWLAEQATASNSPADVRFFLRVLKAFYEHDVVTDDSIFDWFKSVDARSVGGEKGKTLWSGSKPFLEALAADSDDDDDDDDDSE
ncbi:translation initiation factor eIF-2B epsilon subunit, GEF [Microbotryomycetes sp. JL201]|nr:translation initiation factor eIF-2B epsilon subunit, GEF [Microbotryomycetes sp. JL201]